MSLNAAF